jgi:hypothetical protein
MPADQSIHCEDFPCRDVRHECYHLADIDPASVKLLLISETAPARLEDGFYAGDQALFYDPSMFVSPGTRAGFVT